MSEQNLGKKSTSIKGRPIKPSEIGIYAKEIFPTEVFDAVNELIVRRWHKNGAVLSYIETVKLISEELGLDIKEVRELGYDNFESSYREEGWKVDLIEGEYFFEKE